jgi:hypothetical protein
MCVAAEEVHVVCVSEEMQRSYVCLVALSWRVWCRGDPGGNMALVTLSLWFRWQGPLEQCPVWRVARSTYTLRCSVSEEYEVVDEERSPRIEL